MSSKSDCFSIISTIPDVETIYTPTETDQMSDDFEILDQQEQASQWDDTSSCSTSVVSRAYEYEFVHGRRYHGYKAGLYPLPNDLAEQQREDTVHVMMLELMDGQPFLSDIGDDPQRIIDIGTGTGTWAIDVANLYPEALVIGTDLSPIQPSWLPVNVKMFVEDCEEPDWLHGSWYDLIHFRSMASTLRNLNGILTKLYPHLRAGGWVEFQEITPRILCDDGTMEKDDALKEFFDLYAEGMDTLGLRMREPREMQKALVDAGLKDTQCIIKKVPISRWPLDKQLRTLGTLMESSILEVLDAMAAKPLAALDMPSEKRRMLAARAKESLRSSAAHRYVQAYFCFGHASRSIDIILPSAYTYRSRRKIGIEHCIHDSTGAAPSSIMSATITKTAATSVLNHSAPRFNFSFTPFLQQTYQVGLPPDRPICKAFQTGHCPNGTRCPERHVSEPGSKVQQPTGGLNSLVCKHWLRGLCKKGEHCEFLHEYNLRKMPECNFFMRNGYCSNGEECLYLHIDPSSRLPPCPHYDMGFCPLGPNCSKKHVRRKLCPYYLAGFCPDGPECKVGAHPKWSTDLEKPTVKSEEKKDVDMRTDQFRGDDESDRMRDMRDRDDGRHGGRHGRGGGGGPGKWRGSRGGRFRGRGH
ncbi:mRNA 3'-end-processing protein YTH1 [Paramyrothecium foliicola]|nr:mRNA 3'-end-processing protein YTH1 [Paramyrothecium foliicola]